VLNRDRVFFVDQVAAPHRLQALSAVGVSLPASCAAIEKALLADLERVRAGGVAYDREELTIGISAVGGRSATPASSSRRSASPCRRRGSPARRSALQGCC
jgi:DNA-binding IclR family transcriptional regulator